MPQPVEDSDDIRENAARLRALIEMATDGIITIDARGTMETVNVSACELFGYDADEMVGQNVKMLMPPPDRTQHDGYLRRYHDTGEARIIGIGREVIGLRKNGQTFPLRLAVSEVNLGERKIYTGIIHDITEVREAQNAVLQLNRELEQKVLARTEELKLSIEKLVSVNDTLEREMDQRKQIESVLRKREKELNKALSKEKELGELKSRFVSMASHEFKTPLSTVLSSVELIEMYQSESQQGKRKKHIDRIRAAVDQLTVILGDFLSLSRLEQGNMEVHWQTVSLKAAVENALETAASQLKPGQRVEISLADAPREIHTDPKLLQAILTNLISNAAKYSREGQTIAIEGGKKAGGGYFLSIADQGIGIPIQEQERLFTRFFRASNAENIKGTGLGLNIVGQYVGLLGGEIHFESAENRGSTFTITFPAQQTQ